LSPFLSIVIPAHNEQNRLPGTLEKVFHFLNQQSFTSEVIVVENGSTDITYDLAARYAKQHENLRVLQSEKGKGAAVRQGMLEAKGDYRFMCDADLSMPVEEIVKFILPRSKTLILRSLPEKPKALFAITNRPIAIWADAGSTS